MRSEVEFRAKFRVSFLQAAIVIALSGMASETWAVLGEARLQSGVGQTLRAQIPTTGIIEEDLDPRCFRVFRPGATDGIHYPGDLYLAFEEVGNTKRIFARTRGAVQEPVLRFGVEWMCGPSVKREFTLLLDPVSAVEIAPVAAAQPIAATPLALPPIASPLGDAAPSLSRYSTPPNFEAPPPRARRRANADAADEATAMRRKSVTARLAIRGSADSITRDLNLDALTSPRLRLSTLLTLGGTTATVNEVDRAVMLSKRDRLLRSQIESDLRPQLEVDLMVAQKRIAELQARLASADPSAAAATAQAAVAVAPTAPASPAVGTGIAPSTSAPVNPATVVATAPKQPKVSREIEPTGGSFGNWLLRWFWIPASLAIAAGGATLLWLNRKRKKEYQERAYAAAAAAVGLSPDVNPVQAGGGFVDTRSKGMGSLLGPSSIIGKSAPKADESLRPMPSGSLATAAKSSTPIGMTTIKGHGTAGPLDLSSDLFQPNFDTAQLGVSVVSAVTEEASVYVELGRIEEAIGVLKDHNELERAYSRATPAPWLMLLELYHRTDNRPEFESLRAEFMKHFNGRIPEWGSFDDVTSEKPLIEHEHIVERLSRYWGTPKCHQYIHKLLYDHRDNSRIGFSLTAYRELVMLDSVHNSAFPPIEQVGVEIPEEF